MSYKLLYTKSAIKDIRRLDIVTTRRLGKKLEEFSKNPLTSSRRLTDQKCGTYRYRIGNYRIIFDIDRNNIVILRIRHRKEVYKK